MDCHGALGWGRVDVEADVKEEGQVNGVESAVKGDGFYVNVHGDHFGFPAADTDGIVDHLLDGRCEIHPEIFQTVFIAAGIVNEMCIRDSCMTETPTPVSP